MASQPTTGVDPSLPPWVTEVHIGILFILGSGIFFTILDTSAKQLTLSHHVMQVVWARYAFQTMLIPFMVGRVSLRQVIRTNNLSLQIVRSFLLLGATILFIAAISYIPLADASAVGKVGPLFVTALSIPLLGEKVGPRRWAAVFVGFVGTMVIIRPGMGVAHWAIVLPLLTALCFSLYTITTRILSRIDPPVTTFVYTGVVGTLVTTAAVPFYWTDPTLASWALMAGLGAVAGCGHLCLIKAYQRAPASLLAPFSFVQLLWVTLAGYMVFGDFPDGPTIAGALIIMASGVYVIYREAIVGRRKPPTAEAGET